MKSKPDLPVNGTRPDDPTKNLPLWQEPKPSLTALPSMTRGTGTIFSDKLAFPDEPPSTSTIKREKKEQPKHSDSGQALDSRQELDVGRELNGEWKLYDG